MSLATQTLTEILELVSGPDADRSSLRDFRSRFPGVSLTVCDATDVDNETPFREFPRFVVYLVDGADHCWHLTTDPSRATGVVLAQRRTAA